MEKETIYSFLPQNRKQRGICNCYHNKADNWNKSPPNLLVLPVSKKFHDMKELLYTLIKQMKKIKSTTYHFDVQSLSNGKESLPVDFVAFL